MKTSFSSNFYRYSPYLLLIIAFLVNFGWHISDHDDGHTLAYHAFGRIPEIQHTYGAYDSMCDFLLSLLPQDFKIIFSVMVIATVISSMAVLYLMTNIVRKFTNIDSKSINIAALLYLLAIPDFLYLSFTFKSNIISFAWLLLSFYLLIKASQQNKINYQKLLLSAIIFGFGVSLRWTNLTYGLVPAVYLIYFYCNEKKFLNAGLFSAFWGIASLFFSVLWIWVSGYSPIKIIDAIRWGAGYIDKADLSKAVLFSITQTFITPVTLIFIFIALYFLISKFKTYLLPIIFTIATFATFGVLGYFYSFKSIIAVWPIFFLVFALAVFHSRELLIKYKKYKLLIGIPFLLLLLFPWFIGIHIYSKNTNWGPGFDIKDKKENFTNNAELNQRMNFEKITPGFFSGFAFPTAEGVRPLYGHFYALYGGDLKRFDIKLNKYADDVIQYANRTGATIFVDREHPYLQASLFKNAYTTHDPFSTGPITDRVYFTAKGDSIKEMRFVNPKKMFNVDSIYNHSNTKEYIAYFTFSSDLNKLEILLSEDGRFVTQRIGPFTSLISKK